MTLPIVSSLMKKKKQPSLVLTLSVAGLLIGVGSAAYWFFTQGQPFSRNLPVGANIIPQDALLTISVTTDNQEWGKLRELGTVATQREIEKNLTQLQKRFLTNNGYNFEKDIKPWVGDEVTIAVLPRAIVNDTSQPKSTDQNIYKQSMIMVLPIKKPEVANSAFMQNKLQNQGKLVEHKYQGITITQKQGNPGEKLSAAVINQQFMLITDDIKTMERTINSFKNQTSLSRLTGFAENFSKISNYKPFAQFYINVPTAAKIAAQTPNRALPNQVLTQLQNNQGLAGNITLEPQGIRLKGVSWLNSHSRRVLAVENKAGSMQNRLPRETLMMFSGSNLNHFWTDYISTSKGNPLAPFNPEELKKSVKSLINLDLEQDLLSWMTGEFSIAVIPNSSNDATPDNFRVGLVFMIKAGNPQGERRKLAETTLEKLDNVVKNQYQFKVESATVVGKSVVNWISPFGTLTATHGWLDEELLFFVLGAPITEKIITKPNQTLASNFLFQQTVPQELNPANSLFFLDMERVVNNFSFNRGLSNQQAFLSAIKTVGVKTAVKDNRSQQYDVVLKLKKVKN
ncbi:DUF3352 domain-containing protein [Okeanomitos corallinicola TIOX110]|uniref:DUF3352 domain-containing protein n=1 Tax=Okeanomitos corallinicola TIOX110 TaxID=3133117 RepID=A0ABZ2UTT0_9CYAN